MPLPDFTRLFEDGREVGSDYGPVVLRRHAAGELVTPTGRVVACDPAAQPETGPYAVALPAGGHPVVLSVAHFEDGDQRVAGAMVIAGAGRPLRWELALLPGEDPAELGAGEVFGYASDSSLGCFMDAEAALAYAERLDDDEDFFDLIADELEKTYVDTWSWANFGLGPAGGLNVVVFSAGFGEGPFASYVGYDERGEAVRLVTDFALFEHGQLA